MCCWTYSYVKNACYLYKNNRFICAAVLASGKGDSKTKMVWQKQTNVFHCHVNKSDATYVRLEVSYIVLFWCNRYFLFKNTQGVRNVSDQWMTFWNKLLLLEKIFTLRIKLYFQVGIIILPIIMWWLYYNNDLLDKLLICCCWG